MKNYSLDMNQLTEAILSSLEPATKNALTLKEIDKLGGIGDGRPIPDIVRKILELRAPAWGFPGLWSKEKISSLKGLKIRDLINLILADENFKPFRFWNIEELESALPGKCHLLDLVEPPVSFFYAGLDDNITEYPVLTLVQHDTELEVVAEAPNLVVYYAMNLGIIQAPKYVGGLAENADIRKAMTVSLKKSRLKPISTPERLYWEASEKDIPEQHSKIPKTVPQKIPDWVKEYCAPWLALAEIAWDKVLNADDTRLVHAFQSVNDETLTYNVEGKRADTLRKSMLLMEDKEVVPFNKFILLFAIVSVLEPENAFDFLMKALITKADEKKSIHPYIEYEDIHLDLIEVASRRIFNDMKFWDYLFNEDDIFAKAFKITRDDSLLFNIGYGLAKTNLFTDEMYISDIDMLLKQKNDGPISKSCFPDEMKYIHIKMIALLVRNTAYKERIEKYGRQYDELLKQKGPEEYRSLIKQCMEMIFIVINRKDYEY